MAETPHYAEGGSIQNSSNDAVVMPVKSRLRYGYAPARHLSGTPYLRESSRVMTQGSTLHTTRNSGWQRGRDREFQEAIGFASSNVATFWKLFETLG